MKYKFRKGQRVQWRGGFGRDGAKPALIAGTGEKNGRPVYDLDNGHWCYEEQLSADTATLEITPL
jgi:hypothetical protein